MTWPVVLKRGGLRTAVISNGTTLRKQDLAVLWRECFDEVTISVDGGDAETHEKTRGKGTFAKTMAAIGLLNTAGVVPSINHVVSSDNVDRVDRLIEVLGEYRIQRIRMMHHSDLGRAVTDDMSFGWSHFLTTQDLYWTAPDWVKVKPDGPIHSAGMAPKANCGLGGNEIYVDSLGNVYPCKLVTDRQFHAGNVKLKPLGEIVGSPLLRNMATSCRSR